MANIIINGNVFAAPTSGVLVKPVSVRLQTNKVGTSIVAASGARTFVQRAVKYEWAIRWENVPEATRSTVAGIAALGATFAYVDENGGSYTVQTEEADHSQETAFADRAGTQYYNIDLTLRQA